MKNKKKGHYSISAVSNMVGIHPQTIRMYEREGFICPRRSDGNTRMFSDEDIEKLEQIIFYTNKLGINLAGIEVILKMQKRIEKLQNQVNEIFKSSQNELINEEIQYNEESIRIKDKIKKIKSSKKKLNLYQDEKIEENIEKEE
jgi:MerR family transcriptional regulator/heat shock protein HspR